MSKAGGSMIPKAGPAATHKLKWWHDQEKDCYVFQYDGKKTVMTKELLLDMSALQLMQFFGTGFSWTDPKQWFVTKEMMDNTPLYPGKVFQSLYQSVASVPEHEAFVLVDVGGEFLVPPEFLEAIAEPKTPKTQNFWSSQWLVDDPIKEYEKAIAKILADKIDAAILAKHLYPIVTIP